MVFGEISGCGDWTKVSEGAIGPHGSRLFRGRFARVAGAALASFQEEPQFSGWQNDWRWSMGAVVFC